MSVSKRTSPSQFETILDFCELYPQMLCGKVDDIFTKDVKNKRWEDLIYVLNADVNGPTKSMEAWRKTLKDWKCYVKRKAGRIALLNQTIGGPKEELTAIEERLLAAIRKATADEQKSVTESPISGDADEQKSVTESPISGDADLDVYMKVMDPEDDTHNYYVKQGQIRLVGGRNNKLNIEERLLAVIHKATAGEQKSVTELPISRDADLDVSTDMNVMDPEDDTQNYYGHRKSVKRKDSFAAEVAEKFISSLNATNEIERRMAEKKLALMEEQVTLLDRRTLAAEREAAVENQNKTNESHRMAERKLALMEKQVALLERRTLAAEKKAAANEKLVSLQVKKLRYRWRSKNLEMRMKKLEYL